jgi:hypothetical protein
MVVEEGIAPAGECGKPVIYLYPEHAQEISVKVNIDRFTVTIPEHGKNGWTVWAEPSGRLTNKADGQVYPYLFWEGEKDGNIASLGQSFTLARSEIKSKLPAVLADLGLNKQEAKDFMIFWAPRMLNEDTPFEIKPRMDDSRPDPTPLTITAASRIPIAPALAPIISPTLAAAKGVPFFAPLKPMAPDDDVDKTLPLLSVRTSWVLLYVERT